MTVDRTNMGRRKKTLIIKLVAGGLMCLLLFRVDFLGLLSLKLLGSNSPDNQDRVGACEGTNCRQVNEESPSFLRRMMNRIEESVTRPSCEIPLLKNSIFVKPDKEVKCVRSAPSQASCRVVQELFGDVAEWAKTKHCSGQHAKDYCRTKLSDGQFQVHCNISFCGEQRDVHLGVYDVNSGRYKWQSYKDTNTLETAILDLTRADNPGYCIVGCEMERKMYGIKDDPLTEELGFRLQNPQLLNLPPNIIKANNKHSSIDFNIVFIDSTSRDHFFRTLPQTRAVLEELLEDGTPYTFAEKTAVLDFTLVQGVRSRTYETLQTFFSGYVNPYEKAFGTYAMPKGALRIETLLKPLKKLDYQTLWLEDLCPLWEWGLSKDLLAYDSDIGVTTLLKNLRKGLDKAGIDSIGNTLSSCTALHIYGHQDPFHGPDEICFGGRPHLTYQFDYLKQFQETMQAKNRSFFTFLETNIAHDETGKRIVLLDSALAKYLDFVKSMPNAITILMSDHGNSYGKYFQRSTLGQVELYHPFLFIIIPKSIQNLITKSKMQDLLKNQYKLVSMLDLHYMIQDIIDSLQSMNNMDKEDVSFTSSVFEFNKMFHVTKQGLLGNISESRTCSIMPRIMPNLCICKDFEVKRTKFAYYYILALFTIGELNNNIQTQRRRSVKGDNLAGGFGRCVRLKLATEPIKNIQDSQDRGGIKSVTMDVHISTPVQKQPEIYLVALNIDQEEAGKLALVNYDRVSLYSKYSVCADSGVTLSLCICDLQKSSLSVIYNYTYDYLDSKEQSDAWKTIENPTLRSTAKNIIHKNLKVRIKELEIMGSKCVAIVMGSNEAGVVVEGINACTVVVKVSLDLKTDGVILSTDKQIEEMLYPGDITFLVAGLADAEAKWNWEMDIRYSVVTK